MIVLGATAAGSTISRASGLLGPEGVDGWIKYQGNPVLGGQYGTCFDVCVLHEDGKYKMWVSWRPKAEYCHY